MSFTEAQYLTLIGEHRISLVVLTLLAGEFDDEAMGALRWLRRHGAAGAREALLAAAEARATARCNAEAVASW